MGKEKQSTVSNYVSHVMRNKVGLEQERKHQNMSKYQAPVCDKTVKQQQWSHRPEKEARIHYNIMNNASVISASVKLDESAPHTNDRRNNSGKARNHERINDQCKTGNKMNGQ